MYYEETLSINKSWNFIQTSLYILGMLVMLWLLMSFIIGNYIVSFLIFAVTVFVFLNPVISQKVIFNFTKTQKLLYHDSPLLIEILRQISYQADIEEPELYYISDNNMNAFTSYFRKKPVIVLSAGLLRALNQREIQGVIAHEISHIKNKDIFLLTFAQATRWLITVLSVIGQFLILMSLPFMFWGAPSISLFMFLVIFSSPFISRLLWLGLSRTREYQADIKAAELTEDPLGLASALSRISFRQHSLFDLLFRRAYSSRYRESDILKTHPDVQMRIEKLKSLSKRTMGHRFQ